MVMILNIVGQAILLILVTTVVSWMVIDTLKFFRGIEE
ncbi:hypothetical protein H175_11p19 (plasmid) [Bacillus thuringiensis serovar thuringiensis str. IS5056]|nr:hypothetical protein H175_11p19 [Bacillus thuringiensis serovar thuringiensis str. IS5056]